MKITPYTNLPDHCFWKRSVTSVNPSEFDPIVSVPFQITQQDKVATAGSCFAQHIARYLRNSGFHFLITEQAHPIISHENAFIYNYGTFTARYGNLYTTRQLLQLFKRAYGNFTPRDNKWIGKKGQLIDPFRPQIQPNGFASLAEFEADRQQHLAAVRTAFETLDVFVFTLGLTECWEAIADDAVFPLCPGVAGGEFDAKKYRLHNFTVSEVVADMLDFIDLIRSVNEKAKIILTVSPVPLIATASASQHVLTATTYSKSVLRVACEEIAGQRNQVAYFPSYEIITGNYARGAYFASNCRSVLENGVAHVMRIFLKHFANVELSTETTDNPGMPIKNTEYLHLKQMEKLIEVNCDEEAIR
ncbi:MAG: GSCFA domain-containing protein [Methylovulum sp.]|uniref:GSCFA domain-containing protein n=1 Tax=Methylovulum sp. TaxID=1916980 RepID=UPI0026028E66|nr:GSCFA domain-containing protein [Methylovulum sp.]MDD2723233.1 GSCFA domain-containing protein [Methylovulum sp.]MDD5123446.1 GSCFA domain-containing protein [Methylovulum sp.]